MNEYVSIAVGILMGCCGTISLFVGVFGSFVGVPNRTSVALIIAGIVVIVVGFYFPIWTGAVA